VKRANSGKRGPAAGANRFPKSVDEYLARVPEPARSTLGKVRAAIRSAAPGATEIISYQIPAFRTSQVLVWFAAFADHCSFFPTAAVIEQFKDELNGYRLSKGTVQFPTDKPLPGGLIKKMVKARVAVVESTKR
jgi:uncharacterized protein YdhG (YjbR/CyaY superfamily)